MKILVINGPNLNMLGKREPHIYGNATLDDLISFIKDTFRENFEIEFFQSNHEGEIIDKLHEASDIFDGVVINPGAFSHYSYAIYDAIKSININCVEVHISNIHNRESYRHVSMIAAACKGSVIGFGLDSYRLAVEALVNKL